MYIFLLSYIFPNLVLFLQIYKQSFSDLLRMAGRHHMPLSTDNPRTKQLTVHNSWVASTYYCPNQLWLVGIDVENDTLSFLFLHLSLFSTVHHAGKFLEGGVLSTALQRVGQIGQSTGDKKCT